MEEYKNRETIQKPNMAKTQQSQRINQLLAEYQANNSSNNSIPHTNSSQLRSHLLQTSRQKWLNQKGKGYLIDFDQTQRKKLKQLFNGIDKKKCGSIGVDQLQEILLGLGLVNGLDQVMGLIGNVDGDCSGRIEFDEFIEMIQDDREENKVVVDFFKQLVFTQLSSSTSYSQAKKSLLTKLNLSNCQKPSPSQKQLFKTRLPFEMLVNQIRRNHILSSMDIGRCKRSMGGQDQDKKTKQAKGKEVVKAIQKMEERRILRKLRDGASLVSNNR